jgi:antitoxin FitA
MADLKVRNLDDGVAAALRARARQNGTSVEEEARQALTRSVARRRQAFSRRAAAIRAAIGKLPDGWMESAATIREERDAWG